jgi:hypothetical protein
MACNSPGCYHTGLTTPIPWGLPTDACPTASAEADTGSEAEDDADDGILCGTLLTEEPSLDTAEDARSDSRIT